ncbi:MAG: glycosyltransferase family 61 protein [Caulobacteraceae bacterium]|nr:glycosyltransferase family 61 protein [Caulobacter sp.]
MTPTPAGLHRRGPEHLRGRAELVEADPALELHRHVYATPHVEDGRWGVFDADDRPVDLAVERGLDPLLPLRQIPESPLKRMAYKAPAPAGFDYVYAGRYVHHFGHFLVETLSRLWPWAEGPPARTRLVIHGDGSPAAWFATPYARAAFEALGLTPEHFLHVDRPLRFEALLVPGQSFLPGASAHRAFSRLTGRMGERLTAREPRPPREDRPVFFAKTRLVGGVSHLLNEQALVDRLAERGVEIAHPQAMALAQHVRFLEARPVISGWASSAHHPTLFAQAPGRFSMLSPPWLNSNFALIDGLLGRPGDYWLADGTRSTPQPNSSFLMDRTMDDPRAVADALVATF